MIKFTTTKKETVGPKLSEYIKGGRVNYWHDLVIICMHKSGYRWKKPYQYCNSMRTQ